MRLWRRLRYFLGASLVRLEILGAVGLIILISSLSMFVPLKKNAMFTLATKHDCVVRILNLRRPSRGRTISDNAAQQFAIELELGLCELKNKVTIEFRGRSRTSMSLFQRLFFSFVVLTLPGLALGAAQPVRLKIGTASFSSGTLSLWIA